MMLVFIYLDFLFSFWPTSSANPFLILCLLHRYASLYFAFNQHLPLPTETLIKVVSY